jgi:hypothetical protein
LNSSPLFKGHVKKKKKTCVIFAKFSPAVLAFYQRVHIPARNIPE